MRTCLRPGLSDFPLGDLAMIATVRVTKCAKEPLSSLQSDPRWAWRETTVSPPRALGDGNRRKEEVSPPLFEYLLNIFSRTENEIFKD
jgi:hypothetical protein